MGGKKERKAEKGRNELSGVAAALYRVATRRK
jgi:hypothetical protein